MKHAIRINIDDDMLDGSAVVVLAEKGWGGLDIASAKAYKRELDLDPKKRSTTLRALEDAKNVIDGLSVKIDRMIKKERSRLRTSGK